jgi:hypothetical protein
MYQVEETLTNNSDNEENKNLNINSDNEENKNLNINSDNEENKNNLSKTEIKKIETEKRIKRIHELMQLIDKANEEIHIYQDELWDLLKTQIKLPNKRERKIKDKNEKDKNENNNNNNENNIEKVEKKPSPFDRFFKPVIKNNEPSPIIQKKPRPRAISFDDNTKKDRIDNFEYIDIFQINGIEPEFVRECLEKSDINGDLKLFRRIFIKNIPKDQQLLRYTGGKNYMTKRNDMWIDDLNANYIKHVLCKIYQNSYMSVNDLEHYNGNIDQFLINQDHISLFDDDKYIEKLLTSVTSIIDIKNFDNK